MNCPACKNALSKKTISDLDVDVCRGGCGGIWFDNFELTKVDEKHESMGEALLDIERDDKVSVDHDKRRNCPRCDDLVMMRYHFSIQRQIEVDECPGCAGVWFDAGELAAVRDQFTTEEERKVAAKKHFGALFDGQLKEMERKSKEDAQRAKKFARMFRFILPSYYIPGKQAGGAF